MKTKIVAIVVVASIALNFALVGFILGARGGPGPSFDPTRGFPHWVRTLPEERTHELRSTLRNHYRHGKVLMRDIRQQNRALREVIRSQPFSADALREQLATVRQSQQAAQLQSHESFVQFVTELTDAERAKLSDDMRTKRHLRQYRRPPERHRAPQTNSE